MKPNRIMCMIPAGIAAGIFMFSSCHSGYSLASVEGNRIEVTAALDANPDSTAIAILTPYQKTVDSIMSPVIGQSARFMDRFRPESELSNLVADFCHTAKLNSTIFSSDIVGCNFFFNYIWAINN